LFGSGRGAAAAGKPKAAKQEHNPNSRMTRPAAPPAGTSASRQQRVLPMVVLSGMVLLLAFVLFAGNLFALSLHSNPHSHSPSFSSITNQLNDFARRQIHHAPPEQQPGATLHPHFSPLLPLHLTREFAACAFSAGNLQACAASQPPASPCPRPQTASSARVMLDPALSDADAAWLAKVLRQLLRDVSFPVGMGLALHLAGSVQEADLVLSANAGPQLCHASGATLISVNTLPDAGLGAVNWVSRQQVPAAIPSGAAAPATWTDLDMNLLYSAVRAQVGAAAAAASTSLLSSLPPLLPPPGSAPLSDSLPPPPLPPLRVCVLLEVAKSFALAGAAQVLVVVEGRYGARMRGLLPQDAESGRAAAVQVVDAFPDEQQGMTGNLTWFIHHRAEELVPQLAGHEHYALGWGLCVARRRRGD
jgi:hypothetical protein